MEEGLSQQLLFLLCYLHLLKLILSKMIGYAGLTQDTIAVNVFHESEASEEYSPAEDATALPLHLQGNSNNRLPKQAGTLPYIFRLKTQ